MGFVVTLLSGNARSEQVKMSGSRSIEPCPSPFVRFWMIGLTLLGASGAGGLTSVLGQEADRSYRIAVVRDDVSWYFASAVSNMVAELAPLAAGNYRFEIEDRYDAQGDFSRVPGLLKSAMEDPEVDLIYAAGVAVTEVAAGLPPNERQKPIMGGALQMTDVRGLPITTNGTSAVPNFTFITNPKRVESDLTRLRDLVDPSTVHVLLDRGIMAELRNLDSGRRHFESEMGFRLVMSGAEKTAAATLASLPEDVEAMYVALLPRMEDAERQALFEGLAERGIPVISMLGIVDVRLGAMLGLESDNAGLLARRTALSLHQLLEGVSTDSLPVYLPMEDRLVINLAAATRTGWSPDYDTALEADLLAEEALAGSEPLSLNQAMERAMTANAAVRIAAEEPIIQEQEARILRGNLRPAADLVAGYGASDFSDIANPLMTPSYAHQGTVGVQLRQVLFNDTLRSALRAQRRAVQSAEWQLESQRLDAAMSAVEAFLNVLSAQALRQIEKDNLDLTINNLTLARLRFDLRAAEVSEVVRWERDQARNRAALIQRDAQVQNAMVELNRVMATPRSKRWELEDIAFETPEETYFMEGKLSKVIANLSQFEEFGDFLSWYAVEASPELAGFDEALIGQGIVLRQKKRSFYVPEVALSAEANRGVSGSSFQTTRGQNEMTVGVQLTFPLFSGGIRRAEIRQQAASVRQLAEQREQAVQQIELGALVSRNNIGQAHPNIRLNREALSAAETLYEAVLQKYSLGTENILRLLDAQQALLVQRQQEALAVYQYLLEIHRLQRAIAWFEFEKSPRERDQWLELLTAFLADESSPGRIVGGTDQRANNRAAAAAVVQSAQKE